MAYNPYNFSGLLSSQRPLNMVGGIDPMRGQSLMGQPAQMPSFRSNADVASQFAQQGMQQQPQGLFGRVGSGVSSAARGLGGAFTGEGSSARLSALGASLLQGPSRTPIGFGTSLAQGLLAGNQAVAAEQERKFKRGLLEREEARKEARLKAPNIIKMKSPSGGEVLVDASTGEIVSQPFGSQENLQDDVSSILEKPIGLEEVESAFNLNDAAGGEIADKGIRAGGAIWSRLTGGDVTPDTSTAIAETNRLNLKMSNAIVQSNGGKRTAAIQRLIDEVTPKTSDTNEKYRSKAKALVAAGKDQLSRAQQLLVETSNPKEKTKIREGMRELASAVREYEIVLIKDSQRQSGTGVYSSEYKAQKQKSFSEKSNEELFATLNLGM